MHSALQALSRIGPYSTALRASSVASIGLCIGLWIRAKTVDQSERGNAERRALFVGLWPAMLWVAGDSVRELELHSPAWTGGRAGRTAAVRGRFALRRRSGRS
jgi:hypothetical protein